MVSVSVKVQKLDVHPDIEFVMYNISNGDCTKNLGILNLFYRLKNVRLGVYRNPVYGHWSVLIMGGSGQAESFERISALVGIRSPTSRQTVFFKPCVVPVNSKTKTNIY